MALQLYRSPPLKEFSRCTDKWQPGLRNTQAVSHPSDRPPPATRSPRPLQSSSFMGAFGTLTSPSFKFHENHMGESPQKQMRSMPGIPPAVRTVRKQSGFLGQGSPGRRVLRSRLGGLISPSPARLPCFDGLGNGTPLNALELAQWPCPSMGPACQHCSWLPGTQRVRSSAGPGELPLCL